MAGAAAWVTVTVRAGTPGVVIVIIPVLESAPVFSVALILNEPLPLRLVGTKFDTVNHDVALLATSHVLLEVTLMVAVLDANAGFHVVCDTVRVAPAAA